ncbi:MAG: CCA tRNA nucleotidyltransferase [Nanohaloarchaea archaeon]|nr:CCA tRNA nucleotidyltransferase [Candidatus Nanohaloarchaea archaeon]
MNYQRLREKVLEKHYPSDEEIQELEKQYQEISELIESEFGLETHFAGSASRGTCMKGDRDIDVFVLFPEGTDTNTLEEKGLEIGRKVFEEIGRDYEVDYAEHPYTKGEIKEHEVEIVPCIDTEAENITSSVDRTPHHSRWVKNNLDSKQREDVVMLKRFLRSEGIYGSSLKTEGFSGYLCEVLINKYGSFQNLTEEAVNWREKPVLDPEEHHEELPEKLEKKFSDEALIVIDPVDPERNVASVLSKENLSRFVFACWKFKQSPGIDFFEIEEKTYTEFEVKQEVQGRGDFLVLEFENVDEVEDIVYPQLRKTLGRIEDELKNRDFRIFDSGFHVGDKTRIFLELERELPEIEEMKGPKLFHGEKHVEEFCSKYDNVFVQDDRLVAKVDREYVDGKQFLQEFLSSNLEEKGIPENIEEELSDYGFVDPLDGGEKWLNYLGEKLRVEAKQ